ncbi:hypothetical protein GGF44_000529 [Coemansia sp. RSA 1694]|nr:hypothetical protein GGF44_000529 [Coemansia sp. RSA 1694]
MSAQPSLPTISETNHLSLPEFTQVISLLFEPTALLTRRIYDARPFESYDKLLGRADELIRDLSPLEQLEVLSLSHPIDAALVDNLVIALAVDFEPPRRVSADVDLAGGDVGKVRRKRERTVVFEALDSRCPEIGRDAGYRRIDVALDRRRRRVLAQRLDAGKEPAEQGAHVAARLFESVVI